MLLFKKKIGFTLVEMMIVIAIIGVLAAALFPAYSGYQQRARDAHRITSVSTITRALQLHFNDKEEYPASTINGCLDEVGFKEGPRLLLVRLFLAVPVDPALFRPAFVEQLLHPLGFEGLTTPTIQIPLLQDGVNDTAHMQSGRG